MKRICVFSLTVLFFLCFFGCGFSPFGDDDSEVSVKGIHSVSGFTEVTEGNVRNAFPSYDASNLFYHFYAKKSSGEAAAAESTGAKNSFSFLLENGEWLIYGDVYYGSELTSGTFRTGAKIFSGSSTLSLADSSGDIADFRIVTEIVSSENAKGSANLKICSSVPAVKCARAEWTGPGRITGSQILDFSDSSRKDGVGYYDFFNFGGSNVPAGAYTVKFSFYDDGAVSSASGVTGKIVCATVKTVNILSSLATDSWSDDGIFVSGGSGKIVLSEDCIRISKATKLYVSASASGNGLGIDRSAPLNSLDSAFNLIFNFSMSDVTVCILEGTSADFTRGISLSENVKNISVTTYLADGTINPPAIAKDRRGTLRRPDNSVQIDDNGIAGSSVRFENINIESKLLTAGSADISPLLSLGSAELNVLNCHITDDYFACVKGKSSSICFENVEFQGSKKTGSKAIHLSDAETSLKIQGCAIKNYAEGICLEAEKTNAVVSGSELSGNDVAIKASKFASLELSGITLKNNSGYGIKTCGTFTLSGSCTLDDSFYFDFTGTSDICVNFEENYKNSSTSNAVFISMDSTKLKPGLQVLSGKNISQNRQNFNILETGWQIDENGFLTQKQEDATSFYVDPVSGSDSNSGTSAEPYKTLDAAVKKAKETNERLSGDKNDLFIFINNNIVSDGSASALQNESLCSISTDAGAKKLRLTVEGSSSSAVEIDAAKASRIFYISGNVKIVLKNLSLYGGSVASNGGAIYLDGAELKLENCIVGKTNADIDGLKNGVQNKTYSPDGTTCSNKAAEGGGIYVANKGSLTLSASKILNCYADSSTGGGGGIYVSNNSFLEINDGSEIYANGAAGVSGAAICAKNSHVYFNKGTVRHHFSNAFANVPGIYLSSTTFDMYGGEIRDNYCSDSNFGSGIFIGDGASSVTFYGGSVNNNSSVKDNKSSCDVGYAFSVTSPVVNISGDAYIESIYSPGTYIKILSALTGFSDAKKCAVYAGTSEGTEILEAEDSSVDLSGCMDFFALYKTDLKSPKGFGLVLDSTKTKAVVGKVYKISSYATYSDVSDEAATGQKTFSISTESELNKIAEWTSSYGNNFNGITLVLEKDIALTCDKDDITTHFTPIGINSPFAGTFDGNGHKISNLYVDRADKAGLFASVYGASIKNLTVEGTVVGPSSNGTDPTGVGGIVGYSTSQILIENCVSNVNVSSRCENTGGICGYVNDVDSVIRNCVNIGEIKSDSDRTEGISGNPGIVYNCANFGAVSGKSNVAGIAGNTEKDVSLCYNAGAISASDGVASAAAIANVSGTDTGFYRYCYFKEGTADAAFKGTSAGSGIIKFSDPKQQNLTLELSNRIGTSAYKDYCSPWDKVYTFDGVEYPVCVEIK